MQHGAKELNNLIEQISKKVVDKTINEKYLMSRMAVIVNQFDPVTNSASIIIPTDLGTPTDYKYPNRTGKMKLNSTQWDGDTIKTYGDKVYLIYQTNNISQGWLESNTALTTGKDIKIKSATSYVHTNYPTDNDMVPDMSWMSWWNGAWNSAGQSNLSRCATGTIIGSNGGTITGTFVHQGNNYTYTTGSLGNSTATVYRVLATINIAATYQNTPLCFDIVARGDSRKAHVYILFNNENNTDPSLWRFTSDYNSGSFYLYKTGTSTWQLISDMHGNTYQNMTVVDFQKAAYAASGLQVTWGGSTLSSLPSGAVQAQSLVYPAAEVSEKLGTATVGSTYLPIYLNNGSPTAITNLDLSQGNIWAGTDGDTTAERNVGVQSGAGRIYLYSQASTTGSRGVWLPAHGSGAAKSLIQADSNNNVYYSSGTVTGDLVINKSTSIAQNYPAIIGLRTTQTDNNITTTSAYIAAYDDHDAATYGTNMVINSGGNMFVGGGESPSALYSAAFTGSTGENAFLTADSVVYAYANCNTIANRVGFAINTSGHLVPQKAEAVNTNAQYLGVSGNRWAKLYVGTADSYGSYTQPVYWNAGVPTAALKITSGTDAPSGGSNGDVYIQYTA